MKGIVLVTGSAGGVGRWTVARLAEAGCTVRALVHRSPAPAVDEIVYGDVLDFSSLSRAVDGVAGVIHLAGVTHARAAARYSINVQGTENLLRASEAAGVRRFVFASTRAVGDGAGAYGGSKRAAERAVERSTLATTVVRLPEVFGAGGHEGVDRIASTIRSGRTVLIVGEGRDELRPIHVDDAVDALVNALDSPASPGKTYTLAGSAMTVREFIELCAASQGRTASVIRVPVPFVRLMSSIARLLPLPLYPDQLARLRAAKPELSPDAATDLGFRPRPIFD